MTKFDPTIPASESRVLSEPIRKNFLALNERTDQLTCSASSPVSTSLVIGKSDKTYFENNTFVPFSGLSLNLGSLTSGVSSFNTPGTYKEIIVCFKNDSLLGGIIDFIESQEKTIREHSVDTAAEVINDINLQRQADSYGASAFVPGLASNVSPLDNSIILCSVLVTNSGTIGLRGSINPIFDSDIIDLRPFLQRTVDTKALEDHINASSLSLAHPGSVVTNDIINRTATTVTLTASNTDTIQVSNVSPFNPATLLYNPIVRITSDEINYTTAKVLSINTLASTLTLDHKVSVTGGLTPDLVIMGEISLDRVKFDVVEELSDIIERDYTTGSVQLKPTASSSLTNLTVSGNLTLSNLTATRLMATNGSKVASSVLTLSSWVAGTTNQVTVADDGDGSITLSLPQSIATTSSPSFTGLTVSGLNVAGFVKNSASGVLSTSSSVSLTADVSGTLPVSHGGTGVTSLGTLSSNSGPLSVTGGTGSLITSASLTFAKATTSVDGYLAAADFTTFNNKVSTTRSISTTAPLTGGGDLSADRTLSMPAATTSANGYLTSTDWNTFNSKVSTTRNISTTAPLNGGGNLSGDLTLSMPAATTSANGYLTSTDWNTFNGKMNTSFSNVSGTLGISNGGTGATSALNARANLNILCGTAILPSGASPQITITLANANNYAITATYTTASTYDGYTSIQIKKTSTDFTIYGDAIGTNVPVDYIAILKV